MGKAQLADYLSHLFGNPKTCSLENRIFNAVIILICLTSGIATSYNLILNNHIIITICSATSAIFASLAYGYSRKTRNYQPLVTPVILYFFVVMIVSWLANDGIKGAGAYFFFLLMTSGILLLKQPFSQFMIAIVATLIVLLAVEYFFPSWFIGYKNNTQRFFDVGISLILCLVFNGMIIHTVFREYLRERKLKDALLAQTIKDKEEMIQAHNEIRILRGCLPICASCKKIKDDSGYWNQIEEYLRDHSEVKFSHGICPDCIQRLYPEIEIEQWH